MNCFQIFFIQFVSERGLCQVNIRSDINDRIKEKINILEIPQDIFDDALSAIIQDMYYDSFLLFRVTPEYVDSATCELL